MGPYLVEPRQTQSMLTPPDPESRASVRLDADVYYPQGEGPFPVLLMRQPYGRAIASTVVYAHPIWYASHGYIVVIQDVRGRGSSDGEFRLFAHEVEDGAATVEWAAHLPNSTGQVGMYGFSYQGMTQLYAASTRPPALKTLAPAMVGYDLYRDWAYENGALRLQAGLGWGLQLAAETARRRGDGATYSQLYQAARHLPLMGEIPAYPQLLTDLASDNFFHDWLQHPRDDAYWQGLRPDLSQVNLPMLHVGGWFDPYLSGDLRLFRQMIAQSACPQLFWVGPWGHIPWGRRCGAVDYGAEAAVSIDQLQIRWFDHWLKGKDTGLLESPSVQLFDLGSHRWRSGSDWPQVNDSGGLSYFLQSTGLAGLQPQDGQLRLTPPVIEHRDYWVHDPWRPVPSLGGHSSQPAGSFNRAGLDDRSDVLTYTLSPLPQPLSVAGEIELELWCVADAPSFDLSAVVAQVVVGDTGAESVFNLTQGYCRVDRPTADPALALTAPIRVTLALQPSCFTIPAGAGLRLSLAASDFPAYAVNGGTGASAAESRLMDMRVITLGILHGPDHPSCLRCPRWKSLEVETLNHPFRTGN